MKNKLQSSTYEGTLASVVADNAERIGREIRKQIDRNITAQEAQEIINEIAKEINRCNEQMISVGEKLGVKNLQKIAGFNKNVS